MAAFQLPKRIKSALTCLMLLAYSGYYFFNLFVLIKTAEKTIINDEMANLTMAYFTKGNVTVRSEISHSQTTVPGRQILGHFIRGQIMTLNEAFAKGFRYDSTQFQQSVISGFPLCKDRIDNDQMLFYNDIAFTICNDAENIKSLTQLLRIGNSHVSLDRLIVTEKLLANSSTLCDTFQNTSYLYPESKQAIESKKYLQTLCLNLKNVLILKGDSSEERQEKVSSLEADYRKIFDETTVSTHLVSSNIMQSFNVSMAASTNYNLLSKNVKRHATHHGIFSYSFGKWKDFVISFCFRDQSCVANQKNWIKNAAKQNHIKNHLLVDRILNYSSYAKTPVDMFVDLPSSYLPGHDNDFSALTKLANRNNINMTTWLPSDLNVTVEFGCSKSSISTLIFMNPQLSCNLLGATPTASFSGLSTCTTSCMTHSRNVGLTWALRVVKCLGNDSLIDFIDTRTQKLIPVFKNLSALKPATCKDILTTFSKFQFDSYDFQYYVRDTDPDRVKTAATPSDYANLIQYMNPVDDLIMLSNGKFAGNEIRMRYGNLSTLHGYDNMGIHRVLFTHCLYRIMYKVNGLLFPGVHRRISIGLSKAKKVYYGYQDVSALFSIDHLRKVKLSVSVPSNLSFYVKVLLLLNLSTAFFYVLLLVVNFAVFKKAFPMPENLMSIGRLCIYFPGGKIISIGTSIFCLIAIRQILAQHSIQDIFSTWSNFYQFLVLHLAVVWILYVLDDFSGEILQLDNRYVVKIVFWFYFWAWSICSFPFKGKENVYFLTGITGDVMTGTFQVVTFTANEILLDVCTLILFWTLIKFTYRARSTDTLSFDHHFENVYSKSLCRILFRGINMTNAPFVEITNKTDQNYFGTNMTNSPCLEITNKTDKHAQVKFDCYAQSSTLTTLWINEHSGFDFRLWKWVRWGPNKQQIYVEDYVSNINMKEEGLSANPVSCKSEKLKLKDRSSSKNFKHAIVLSVGLTLFLIYYVIMQFKLLGLVDEVFKNDEMSELSIEHMMSSDVTFIQSNKSSNKNISSIHEGFMLKSLLMNNSIMPIEEAMRMNFSYRNYPPALYYTTLSPCSLRLLYKSLKNETYASHFWNNILCSHGNELVHQRFTQQGNFLTATDSLILTQRLLFNSSDFCSNVFAKHLKSRRSFYMNPYSIESNRSIAYVSALCADMTNVSFHKDDILTKYRSIIKEITVSKYFPDRSFRAYFSWGYQASKYYFNFRHNNLRLNNDLSYYGPGPGNWGCCGYVLCFRTEEYSKYADYWYESTLIRWGVGKIEYISRGKNYNKFEQTPIAILFESPAVYMPKNSEERLVLYNKLKQIELTDVKYYSSISEDFIESKIISTLPYNTAGFTKENCPLFSVSSIDYHLTAYSGCSSEKSRLSISKHEGTVTALRVLKCLKKDSLIGLLQLGPELANQFKLFKLPTDKFCNSLLDEVQGLDWSISPFMYVRSRNKTEQSDMILSKYYNPVEELKRIQSSSLTKYELMKRVGGLALISETDSLSVLLYVSIERIRDKVNALLNPGVMRLFQPGIDKNGSLFYGTVANVKIKNVDSFPNYPGLEISKSYSNFVKFFVTFGIGMSFFYIGILSWSMYTRSVLVPETVMELGRVVLLFPGGNLVAFANGMYSLVGIRQLLSVQSITEMSFGGLMSVAAMHLGSSWLLYITDTFVGEIARLPNTSFVRFVPWIYLLVHGVITLPLKRKRKNFLIENHESGSTWNYIYEIQSFTISDVLIDIGTLVLGWMLLKLLIRHFFKLEPLRFSRHFQETYSTIVCNVLYHTVLDKTQFDTNESGEICFNKDLTIGLSTVWLTKKSGFDFSTFNRVELPDGTFDSMVVRKSITRIGKQKKIYAENH